MTLSRDLETIWQDLHAYARSICDQPTDAEDLVQDAVERVLKARDVPTAKERLRPFMFRVIRNLFYDELRKRRIRKEYSNSQKRLISESASAFQADDAILIRRAYEKLPPSAREILFLVDIMDFRYAEAAEILNVPPGTIMSRVSRARKRLIELIDGAPQKDENERTHARRER
ncbi:MAG: RNA polymerase sigma factor [Pseudomonadota bacterium]